MWSGSIEYQLRRIGYYSLVQFGAKKALLKKIGIRWQK